VPQFKAVFLDRDGVINRTYLRRGKQRAPQDMSEWAYVDGIQEVCALLRERGYLLLCCTNQPDVARGWQAREQVDEFHARILAELPVARIYSCFHDDEPCECRKPKPGMVLEGARDFDVDLSQSWLIGDRDKDIQAGRAAGVRCVYLRHPYDQEPSCAPDYEITQLDELRAIIL